MATTATQTVRQIVEDALLQIGVGTLGQTPSAARSDLARRTLSRMLKEWQLLGHPAFTRTSQSLTLTTAASYTLNPVRPMRILSARLKKDGIETPMFEMSRREYDDLPQKTTTGLPTNFYYDRQREAALFYVWPVLSAAAGETVEITYEREIDDLASLNDTIDVPGEWYDPVVWGLAAELAPVFGKDAQMVQLRAEQKLARALGASSEGSVYFGHGEGNDSR